ncbi:MAG: alpha/beta fold hydrolase [Steroidobacteraceae bacterium]
MTEPVVIFSHGKDSEPWGGKIMAMAAAARDMGYRTESVDYRGIDDPTVRVACLLEFGRSQAMAMPILVGSSLGGHVATAASQELAARGLFLLAPAFYMPGYEQYTPQPAACPISIVHGWRDDVVPVVNSIRYAGEHHACLQVIDADHRMLSHIEQIVAYFQLFLREIK